MRQQTSTNATTNTYVYIVHSFVKAKNICTGTPHGGPLHCAHISSNYIKFDQGQKEIGLLLAISPMKSLNIY